jgi:flagellar protein FlbT
MGLMIEIKRGERLYIGSSIVKTEDPRSRLYIEGDQPILREKDIMTPDQADTLAKRVYFAVQQIYLSQDTARHLGFYQFAIADLLAASPRLRANVQELSALIEGGMLYKALRRAQLLVEAQGLTERSAVHATQ